MGSEKRSGFWTGALPMVGRHLSMDLCGAATSEVLYMPSWKQCRIKAPRGPWANAYGVGMGIAYFQPAYFRIGN